MQCNVCVKCIYVSSINLFVIVCMYIYIYMYRHNDVYIYIHIMSVYAHVYGLCMSMSFFVYVQARTSMNTSLRTEHFLFQLRNRADLIANVTCCALHIALWRRHLYLHCQRNGLMLTTKNRRLRIVCTKLT